MRRFDKAFVVRSGCLQCAFGSSRDVVKLLRQDLGNDDLGLERFLRLQLGDNHGLGHFANGRNRDEDLIAFVSRRRG